MQSHLSVRVSRVPHGIPHHLPRPRLRLDQLELNSGLSHGPERGGLPVGLGVLLPHHRVELIVVLDVGKRPV